MNKFKRSIASIAVSATLGSLPISLVYANEEAEDKAEKSIEKIEVTGSRIKRIDLEPTQPITAIDADYITDRGLTNAATAVTDIPGVFAAATTVQANNEQGATNGVGQNTINIFGIGSQRTLTLVNGSRFVSSNSPIGGSSAPGSQVDVNNIPVELIDRVEVVKVGGAPVYGADAVAGVVNYILKKDYEGASFSYDYRQVGDDNLGTETSLRGLIGGNFNDDKGNLVFSFEYNKTDNIDAKDVPSYNTGWTLLTPPAAERVNNADGEWPTNQLKLYPNPRAGILSFSGVATPGSLMVSGAGVGAWGDGKFYHFDPAGTGNLVEYDTGLNTGNAVWSSGGDGLDLSATNAAQEGYERYNLTMHGNYELGEDVYMTVTAFANRSESGNPGYQSAYYSSGIWNGTESGSMMFDTTNPFLTDQARTFLEGELGGEGSFYLHKGWVNLGQREIINESSVNSLKFALNGSFELGDGYYDWEVAYQKGTSQILSMSDSVSDARFFAALDVGVNPETGEIDCKFNYVDDYGEDYRAQGPGIADDELVLGSVGGCAPLNPFGTISEEAKDYVLYTSMGRSKIEQEIFSAYVSGDVMELPAGELAFAAGYEKRTESADFKSDGTTKLTGFRDDSTMGSYTTEDIFAELYLPIISSDMNIPLVYSLSAETSFRAMDNSSAGSDNAWAVGINYRPFEDMIIRANMAETVRAPSVTELFKPLVESTQFGDDPCDKDAIANGPNPDVRAANCAAEGIPAGFESDAANASRQGLDGGNDSLLNEKASSQNFGIVYSPSFIEGLDLSVDWVKIDIEDAIVSFTLTDIMEACYDGTDYPNVFCTYFKRNPDNQVPALDAFQSGYVNAAFREFETIEYALNYTQEISVLGEFGLKLRAYNLKKNATSNTGFDFDDTTGRFSNPEWRSQIMLSHALGDYSSYVDVQYFGVGRRDHESEEPFKYLDENGNPYDEMPSITTVNVGATYDLTSDIMFRARVENVTNWEPSAKELQASRRTLGRIFNFGVTVKF
jgi:outer membrane receptor for ferrienterochelin and colicin